MTRVSARYYDLFFLLRNDLLTMKLVTQLRCLKFPPSFTFKFVSRISFYSLVTNPQAVHLRACDHGLAIGTGTNPLDLDANKLLNELDVVASLDR